MTTKLCLTVSLGRSGSFRSIHFSPANGQASISGSGVVSAQSDQGIGLRGHDEVVPMEAADLVGPPAHCDTPPLGEERGVVTLRLGEGADPVGEGQRVGEVGEVEDAQAELFHHAPVFASPRPLA